MKITAVSTLVVNARMRNWVFVKVETDEPGLVGWGEASLEWKTRAVAGAVADFAPMLVGQDPARIEHLYQMMYRQSFFRMGVIGMSAISGIEQALWDIRGKVLGVPVYELLGGLVRDRVRMYTHLGGGEMKAVYETQYSSEPQVFVERALEVKARGYSAVKVLITPPTEALNPIAAYRYAERMMAALREASGRRDGHHGRFSRPPVSGQCDRILPRTGALSPLLYRRAGAAGKRRRPGRSAARQPACRLPPANGS